MKLLDVTRTLANDLAPWPGDTAFEFRLTGRIAEGSAVNVGALSMGTHNGTHADAPFHYLKDGATMEMLDPAIFVGPAVVLDLTGRGGDPCAPITPADLAPAGDALAGGIPRLLVKTGVWTDSRRFPERIPVLAAESPAWLGGQGVILLGMDVPSVDAIDSKKLPNHHALDAAGIFILESLDLSAAPPGVCELLAAPLRIAGGDGAPVRALLRYS